jgi:hypothetical protein
MSRGYELRLAPGTCIRFERSTQLQLSTSLSTPTQVVELRTGRLDVRSPTKLRAPQALMVKSPQKVAGVFTTGDGVVVASAQTVTVVSERGGMLVGVGSDWRPLREGFARTISPQDRAGKRRAIPPPPVVHLASPLVLAAGAGTGATWAAVPDAVSYEVSLVGKKGTLTRLTVKEPRVEFDRLASGPYTLTVREVDRYGVPGAVSLPQQVRVVRAILPPGAYVGSDGAIRLETGDRVRLAGAEGLFMTHGALQQFVPAPESVGLFRGTAVRIRLRDRANLGELSVDLVPLVHHASVTFEPRRPRWPDRPVIIRVELYDGKNQPTRESANATVDVRLNQQRLSPQWRRQNNRLIASVRPAVPIGPWSLKVQVARPSGEIIARSLLQIEEM